MNSNIGGVKLPSTGGYTVGWSGLSGTDFTFKGNTGSTNTDQSSGTQVVKVSFNDGFSDVKNATYVESASKNVSWAQNGNSALAAFWVKQAGTEINKSDWFKALVKQTFFEKQFELSPRMAEDTGLQTINKYYTIQDGGVENSLALVIASTMVTVVFTTASCFAKNVVKGKDTDLLTEVGKTGAKQIPTVVFSIAAIFIYKDTKGKRQTKLATALASRFSSTYRGISNIKKMDEYKALANSLKEGLEGKKGFDLLKTKISNSMELNKLQQSLMERRVWGIGANGANTNQGAVAFNFLKSTGCEMGFMFGVDAITSIAGNVLVSWLVQGNSFSDAMKDSKWGEEILKAAVKTVFSKSFELIFSVVGLGALGKVIGTAVASFVNSYVCEPFRGKDGEIDQGWCAAAGVTVIASSILAGAIATAALSSCVPPIGWAVGLIILAAAIVAYALVVAIHWLVTSWDDITDWIGEKIDAVIDFIDEAGNFIADVWNNATEVVSEIAETTACKVVVNILFFGVPALLGYS